jgi:hypothetical protein
LDQSGEKRNSKEKGDIAAIILKQHERRTTTCQAYVRRTQTQQNNLLETKRVAQQY